MSLICLSLYLCAGHAYFRPSVDVDSTVGLSANGTTHCVGNANS